MPLTPLRLVLAPQSLEEVFMARYERLRGWALHLSSDDRAAAEDLLQEAFVQFTITNPDLDSIQNLDAYLFGLIRILHLSQVRRTRRRARLLGSVLDYNAAILGLRHADPRGDLIVREELLRVCQYSCARKETSKAGSVLLLRFFLGYYPGEIARVTKSTRAAVEERLRIARAEAKSYLSGDNSLTVIGEPRPGEAAPEPMPDPALPQDTFLKEMRRRITLSKRGECLPRERWERVYGGEGAVDCPTLAHLVSCENCLETVNELLGLPLLSERHPVDTLGKDAGRRGGGGGGGSEGGGGTTVGGGDESAELNLRRGKNRAREVFEHDPNELCVAVNGDLLCSQAVGGGHNEQTLNFETPVEFVEVFSEQGVRMLLLVVGERPADGPARRTARSALSDGRSLEISLELNHPASTIRVVYEDHQRHWKTEAGAVASEPGGVGIVPPTHGRPHRSGGREPRRRAAGVVGASVREGFARLLAAVRLWLRPGVVTVMLTLLLVASVLFLRLRVGAVSAAELLSRSAAAERADAGGGPALTHRTVYLEQHDAAGAGPARRRRIEVWHSEARGVTVRQVYDEAGAFVIGERVNGRGERVVLLPDAKPVGGRESRPGAAELLAAGAAWRLDPSATDYLELTGGGAEAAAEEEGPNYVVRRRGRAGVGVVEAVLVIRKADMHAVELRAAYVGDSGRREYRLVEALFERPAPDRIPPKLFGDDDSTGAGEFEVADGGARPTAGSPAASAHAAPARASAELEVEVNYLLQSLGTSPGEQVSVRRTPDGRLSVEALVETARRKKSILAALGPVASNPSVILEVDTVDEAAAARAGGGAGTAKSGAGTTKELDVEVRDDAREAEAELASRLGGGDDDRNREEAARVSERALADSRRAVRYAAALGRLTADFPLRVSGSLDPAARRKLLEMLRSNAEGYGRDVRDMAQALAPFSPARRGGAGEAVVIRNDAELARAVERLSRLTRETDAAVRSALTLSQRGQKLDPIKSEQFWDSLDAAQKLSLAILQSYRQ